MNKSIAIICDYTIFPERIGGMDRFFIAYDKALKEKGYSITWFFKDVTYFDFYENLTIENAKGQSVEGYFLNFIKKQKSNYNIVITHFLQPVSSFHKKVKQQINPYIINVDHNPRPLNGFSIKKRIKNKIKGLLYSKYIDRLIGVSKYTSKHIIKDFGTIVKHKTGVIYNGIETSIHIKQNIDRTVAPFKFLVVSHLRESKGIQDLLKAVSLLEDDLKVKLNIDIYGEGPYRNTLLDLLKNYKLSNIIDFKGSSPKINELLVNYHYLIQPTYMECFSLSLLESLASNVPVITTTVGGNPEIIENDVNGYIFEPKDVDALVSILTKILKNEISIKNEVYSKIENDFTLDIMVKNHINLLPCT